MKYFLPSVDEWYKAAYYDGQLGVYYEFATGSNTAPTPVASGTTPQTAIYHQRTLAVSTQAGGFVTHETMAQGGNVWEWEETEYDHTNNNTHGERGLQPAIGTTMMSISRRPIAIHSTRLGLTIIASAFESHQSPNQVWLAI